MYRVVKIGDKEVPMLAMASVDIYYKRVFHEDPLSIMTNASIPDGEKTRVAFGMAYIMAKFAECRDRKAMLRLTEDDYLEWLEQFEYGDFVAAAAEVLGVYYGQKIVGAKEKKDIKP